jgi:hypothetical protein
MRRHWWYGIAAVIAAFAVGAMDIHARGGGGGGGGRGGGGGGRGGGGRGGGGRGGGAGGGGGMRGGGRGPGGPGGGGFGIGRNNSKSQGEKTAKEWQLLLEQADRKRLIQERRDALMASDRAKNQEAWLALQRMTSALGEDLRGAAPSNGNGNGKAGQ